MARDTEANIDPARQGLEPIRGNGERSGEAGADLDVVASGEPLVGPAPYQPSGGLDPPETGIDGICKDLDRRLVRVDLDQTGEVIDNEVVHRPALALLPDDYALEAPTPAGALALRAGTKAREDVRDGLTRPDRRDPEGVPRACRHRGVGGDNADRERPVPVNELVQ